MSPISISSHCPLSFSQAPLINLSNIDNFLGMLGIEPRAAGWEASMLPLCFYPLPPKLPFNLTISFHHQMTAANIGVCFGPTLLRPREETVATIMDIKFCNEVVQILIENCDKFFSSVESSPEVARTSEVDGREQRGSSTPKRTHSFSSFSQVCSH